MFRKLKSVVQMGILGTCFGVFAGIWIWLLSWLVSGSGRVLPLGSTVFNAGLSGTLAGTLFAVGLTLRAHVGERVAFSKRIASTLGASVGALAFPLLVLMRELPVSHWGYLNWISAIWMNGLFGWMVGRILWSVASKAQPTGICDASDQAEIGAPSLLDGSSYQWEASSEQESSPRLERRSPTSLDSDR